jgi:plastocyanin
MEVKRLDESVPRSRTLICLFVCVPVVVAYLLNADPSSAQKHDDSNVVVRVTDEGFDPKSLEIGPGETVVFENSGQNAHWPASDDHPTHTLYPEFDPLKPIEPGVGWSFTFDKSGEWKYHDHQNPYLKGEIVVQEAGEDDTSGGFLASVRAFFLDAYSSIISTIVPGKEEVASNYEEREEKNEKTANGADAKELPQEQFEETKDGYVAVVRDEDPGVALGQLRDEIGANEALARSCHALVHELGREAYRKYEDFGEAMKYQDEMCNSGYLHGIIESRLSESHDPFSDMETMCDEYPPASFLSWQCYHGVGHGVMYYTANDLPRSLEMCDAFGSSSARSDCSNGVFMENFSADQKHHLSEYLSESDPFYPCAEQAQRHKSYCYVYAPTYFLSLNKGNYLGALEWCNGAEEPFRAWCAGGVGAQTMKENIRNPKLVEGVCASSKPEQVAPCIQGMVDLYINHHGSLGPARELCDQLEASNRQPCYKTVESKSKLFST